MNLRQYGFAQRSRQQSSRIFKLAAHSPTRTVGEQEKIEIKILRGNALKKHGRTDDSKLDWE